MTALWVTEGGRPDITAGGPVLLLLHGLGHTGEVWRGLVELLPGQWPGSWLAPDLPGHGRSGWADRYSYNVLTAEVTALLPAGRPVLAVGHSMGGALAIALAGAAGQVRAVVGFGIKVTWTEDELAAMQARAARPPRTFGTEGEARAAFVRFGGLEGLVDPGSELAATGVQAAEGGYRLATDPRTMLVGAPPMAQLLAASTAPVVLAAGEHDHMVSAAELRALDDHAVVLTGVGHNLHITDPDRLLPLIKQAASRMPGDEIRPGPGDEIRPGPGDEIRPGPGPHRA